MLSAIAVWESYKIQHITVGGRSIWLGLLWCHSVCRKAFHPTSSTTEFMCSALMALTIVWASICAFAHSTLSLLLQMLWAWLFRSFMASTWEEFPDMMIDTSEALSPPALSHSLWEFFHLSLMWRKQTLLFPWGLIHHHLIHVLYPFQPYLEEGDWWCLLQCSLKACYQIHGFLYYFF